MKPIRIRTAVTALALLASSVSVQAREDMREKLLRDFPAFEQELKAMDDQLTKEFIPDLILLLKDEYDAVRRDALRGLGEIGRILRASRPSEIDEDMKMAAPALAGSLADDDAAVRVSAAEALGKIGPASETAVEALLQSVKKDESPVVRAAAALALGEIKAGSPQAIDALVKKLKDDHPNVRSCAAIALGRIGPAAQESVPALIKILEKDPDGPFRAQAALALGSVAALPAKTIPTLILALKDRDVEVKKASCRGLANFGPQAAKAGDPLSELIRKDPDPSVKVCAAYALGRINPESKEVVPLLVDALKNGDAGVRALAAEALGQVYQTKDAVPELMEALKDEAAAVRSFAAKSLGKAGSRAREAVSLLIQALEDREASVRAEAAQTLGQAGPQAAKAVPAMIKMLQNDEIRLQKIAALALGRIGAAAKEAVSPLLELYEKWKEKNARLEALSILDEALKNITGKGYDLLKGKPAPQASYYLLIQIHSSPSGAQILGPRGEEWGTTGGMEPLARVYKHSQEKIEVKFTAKKEGYQDEEYQAFYLSEHPTREEAEKDPEKITVSLSPK